jgi:molybdate transport system substrate-binding protein
MADTLRVLSAGAAKHLVETLTGEFEVKYDTLVEASFGAVGAMRDALLAGAPCDVLITSESMRSRLIREGSLRDDHYADIGRVHTAIAVRSGDPAPDVATPEALSTCFMAADGIYCPDIVRATAGIHLASVLKKLRIYDEVGARLQEFPNGAIAMGELARAGSEHPVGCTQMTEIIYTAGTDVVGRLPEPFGLSTMYQAVVTPAAYNEPAMQFVAFLTDPQHRDARQRAGFE